MTSFAVSALLALSAPLSAAPVLAPSLGPGLGGGLPGGPGGGLGGGPGGGPAINPSVLEANAPGGDYPDLPAASNNNLGALAVGQTSLIASLKLFCDASFDCSGTGGLLDPSDAFFFEVAAGTQVTALVFGADGGSERETSGLTFRAALGKDETAAGAITFEDVAGETSFTPLLAAGQVLEAGSYHFSFGVLSSTVQGDFGVNWNALAVVEALPSSEPEPVPLPASLPLLLAGLGGLALARRKRR